MVKTFRFVFGFQLNEQGECKTAFAKNAVYKGKVVAYRYQFKGSDFALIKLNQRVDRQRPPLRLDSTRVQPGEALTLVEHGEGLPLKISAHSTCQAVPFTSPERFHANFPASEGSSGGPAIDPSTGSVRGMLVRGNRYVEQREDLVVRRRVTEKEISKLGYEQCQRMDDPALIKAIEKQRIFTRRRK